MALDLAARGEGQTAPNPMVGAVLVRGGRVVGKGYHTRAGAPHAEAVALAQAGAKARGAVLYVADHRTKAWIRADAAVFTAVASLATPMDSHLIAHADAASRDADPGAVLGRPYF